MEKRYKCLFIILASFLSVVAASFFFIAIFHNAHQITAPESQIHVFINQNDSVVTKLQEDVEHLSMLIEKMNADTVIIEMRKPGRAE